MEEDDAVLVNHITQAPFSTAVQACEVTNFPGSVRTARRRIRAAGLINSAAAMKVFLTQENKEARVGFSLQYLNEANDFWSRVVFSDEKVFQSCNNARVRVYRPRDQRFEEMYVKSVNNSGRFSVNVWAWISADGRGAYFTIRERLTGEIYRHILNTIMLPSVSERFPDNNFIFQQDNCPVHTSRIVKQWMRENNINLLDWPSKSPDLNPIENVWAFLLKNIHSQPNRPRNRAELLEMIEQAWQQLDQNVVRRLVMSMNRRLQSVLEGNGAATKY